MAKGNHEHQAFPPLDGGPAHLRTLVQPLLVLLSLADTRGMALELCGPTECCAAVDAGHGRIALLVVLFELRFLYSVTAS